MKKIASEKRTKEIKIRLTHEEYNALMLKKTKPRLAEWLREIGLEEKPKQKAKPVNKEFLFALNKIGVNLNQIAKYCNEKKADMDLVKIGSALRNIEVALERLTKGVPCDR